VSQLRTTAVLAVTSTLCALMWLSPTAQGQSSNAPPPSTPASSPEIVADLNAYLGLKVRNIAFKDLPAIEQTPKQLEDLLTLKPGSVLTREALRGSLQKLYVLGFFSQIDVEAVRAGVGEVDLNFVTKANFFVGQLGVLGVKNKPSGSELINATKLSLGELFDEAEVARGMERMKTVMENNGYYKSQISVSYDLNQPTQQVNITFQVAPGEVAHIGKVEILGQPGYSDEEIEKIAKFHPGGQVANVRVTRALQLLRKRYQKKKRLEAQVSVTQRKYDPATNVVDYTFQIDRGPVVDIAVEGARLRNSLINKYVPVYEENAVDEDLLNEGRNNLRDYFQSKGYFDVTVNFSDRTDTARQHTAIIYDVDLGPRHKLTELAVEGNKYFDNTTIRERMRIAPSSLLFPTGLFSQALLKSDISAIENLYKANGFQSVKVEPQVEDDYKGQQGRMKLTLQITEGPQTRVQTLKISGNETYSTDRLLEVITSTRGEPYSEFNLSADRDAVLNFYFNRGFPDVRFEAIAEAAPNQPDRIDLQYQITEGEQRFVNRVLISGLNHTRPFVVDRELQIRNGQPLSQLDMLDSQRRLYDLGIFNRVDVAVQNPEGAARSKNVLLQLEEARRYTITYGLGMEVQTGSNPANCQNGVNAQTATGPILTCSPQGRTGVSPRVSFDVTRTNFLGRDYTILFKSRYGRLQQRGLISLEAPRIFNNEGLKLTFNTFYDKTQDVLTFTAQRIEGSAQFEQLWSKATTLLYRLTYRRVNVDPATLQVDPNLIPLLSRPVLVAMPNFTYIRDTRDNPIDSTRGRYNTMDLGLASSAFGGQTDFTRLLVQNSTYHVLNRKQSVVSKKWVVARSTRIGIEEPYGSPDLALVPLPEKYFAGGSNSHRGFAINQAGPRDLQTGFPIGGEALFVNNVELRTPPIQLPYVEQNLSAVIFHDMGNVFASAGDIFPSLFRLSQKNVSSCKDLSPTATCDFNYFSHAVGAGLRYRTPIGPVRVDVGYNLNPTIFSIRTPGQQQTQTLRRINLFFSIGQTF